MCSCAAAVLRIGASATSDARDRGAFARSRRRALVLRSSPSVSRIVRSPWPCLAKDAFVPYATGVSVGVAGTQPSRPVGTVEFSFKQVATMDFDASQQLRILRDIHDTKPVSDEEANWAVRAGYAAQAEDGDIDLTHEGRKALDDGQA